MSSLQTGVELFSGLGATPVTVDIWYHSSPCGEWYHVVAEVQAVATEAQNAAQIAQSRDVTSVGSVIIGYRPGCGTGRPARDRESRGLVQDVCGAVAAPDVGAPAGGVVGKLISYDGLAELLLLLLLLLSQ